MAELVQAGVHTASNMMVRGYKPLNSTCAHVCGIHIYAHDTTRQVVALARYRDEFHESFICVV